MDKTKTDQSWTEIMQSIKGLLSLSGWGKLVRNIYSWSKTLALLLFIYKLYFFPGCVSPISPSCCQFDMKEAGSYQWAFQLRLPLLVTLQQFSAGSLPPPLPLPRMRLNSSKTTGRQTGHENPTNRWTGGRQKGTEYRSVKLQCPGLLKAENVRFSGADLLKIPACLYIKTRTAFYQLREGTTGSLLDPFPRKMNIWELNSVICPQPFSLPTILLLTSSNRETATTHKKKKKKHTPSTH